MSYGNLEFNEWLVLVIFYFEVFEFQIPKRFFGNYEFRELGRFSLELESQAFDVIEINMRVAERVSENAGREVAFLGDHVHECCVARDVERDAECDVGGALVELAIESSVDDVELEEEVAWWQRHFFDLGDVPGADDDAARIGIFFDEVNGLLNLVDMCWVSVFVGGVPFHPLMAVDGTEFAFVVGPGVPDGRVLGQIVVDVGGTFQKPEELAENTVKEDFFRGEQWKSFAKIVFSLHTKERNRTCTGTIFFFFAFFENFTHEREVLFHRYYYTVFLITTSNKTILVII